MDPGPHPGPDRRPDERWPLPPARAAPTAVPGWARLALIAGVLCSFVVAWISAQYFGALARGQPPSVGMVYMIELAPFLLVGVPLLLVGALGAIRPWSSRRPWLRPVIVVGAIAWFLVCLQGPALIAG